MSAGDPQTPGNPESSGLHTPYPIILLVNGSSHRLHLPGNRERVYVSSELSVGWAVHPGSQLPPSLTVLRGGWYDRWDL